MLTVRAPATSANLGSGFDVFGVALGHPADVVRVEKRDRTTIDVRGAGSDFIPEDPEENTVGAVADALDAPAHIQIDKGIRPASGLGSSAASAAAAAVALNELYDRGKTREELVPIFVSSDQAQSMQLAIEGEPFERPLTHDLLIEMISEFGAASTACGIDRLADGTFVREDRPQSSTAAASERTPVVR
ncbi:bifunctional nuclease domain-containing protein, partial [Halapricum sp. CBA1109]|uniref:bifunctional nuclease domain-containing protein n=1 Tax=Halapricum sp. CBA1109 TaxID=2668068 RepID=UPI001E42F4AD